MQGRGHAICRTGRSARRRELADRLGLPEQLARAALGYGGRVLWEVTQRTIRTIYRCSNGPSRSCPKRTAHCGSGCSPVSPPGRCEPSSFPPERRHELSEEALAHGSAHRGPGDAGLRPLGLHLGPSLTRLRGAPGQTVAAELIQRRAERQATSSARSRDTRPVCWRDIEFCRIQEARADLRCDGRAGGRSYASPPRTGSWRSTGSIFALLEGDVRGSGAVADRGAATSGRRAQRWSAAVTYGLQLYVLRRLQGRLDEVVGSDAPLRSRRTPSYYDLALRAGPDGRGAGRAARGKAGVRGAARTRWRTFPSTSSCWRAPACSARPPRTSVTPSARRGAPARPGPYRDRLAICYPEICVGAVARYLGLSRDRDERLGRRRALLRGGHRGQRASRSPAVAGAHPARLRRDARRRGRPRTATVPNSCSRPLGGLRAPGHGPLGRARTAVGFAAWRPSS